MYKKSVNKFFECPQATNGILMSLVLSAALLSRGLPKAEVFWPSASASVAEGFRPKLLAEG